jgi:alkylated DNA repair protein alkB family protein 6
MLTFPLYLPRIREIEEDTITAGNATSPPVLADLGVPIANWDRVTGADAIGVMSKGGVLKRATRYSLTCRDVEKVAQLKAFMKR